MILAFLWLWAARDPVGAAFQQDLEKTAKARCGREFRVALGTPDVVGLVRGFTGGEEGKELYVQFLKDRHGYAVARVNEIYGTDVASFTELLTERFPRVDRARREVQADDGAFLEELKGRWRAVVGQVCRAKGELRVEGEELVFAPERGVSKGL